MGNPSRNINQANEMEIDDDRDIIINEEFTIRATKNGLQGLEKGPITKELILPHFHLDQLHVYVEYIPDELLDEFLRPHDRTGRVRTKDSFNFQGYYITNNKFDYLKVPLYKSAKKIVNPEYQGIAKEWVFGFDLDEVSKKRKKLAKRKDDSSFYYPEGPIREAYRFYDKHATIIQGLDEFITEYDIAKKVFSILKNGGMDVSLLKCEIDRETYLEDDNVKGDFLGYDLAFDRGVWSLVSEILTNHEFSKYLNKYGLLIDYESSKELWEILSLDDDLDHKGWWTIFRISEINSAIFL